MQGEIYYDPFDTEIDDDPYPVWRRMREEAPLYYNERYNFFALSRFDDVRETLRDWTTYCSGRGSVLEWILAEAPVPSGFVLMEDPPVHDVHRSILSRVFTPKDMNMVEPELRAFCARALDPLIGAGGFDFVRDLGAVVPMRAIGMLLGIPEQDQETIRDSVHENVAITDGSTAPPPASAVIDNAAMFGDYIDWRTKNPSDDLMTKLLTAEFEDENGTVRRLTRAEAVSYAQLLAGAGNDTTTKLIGWLGALLGRHPDQRRALVEDRSLVRGAIEETLRFETPSPVQARVLTCPVEHYGQTLPAESTVLILNGSGNRDERHFQHADQYDIRRTIDQHLSFGYGIHFCLGAALARMEGRVVLDEVLKRWPDWEVDWDNVERVHTSTTRGWERLPVVTGSSRS